MPQMALADIYNSDFYATAAQVIPFLIVLLFFSDRFFSRPGPDEPGLRTPFILSGIFLLVAAEADALWSLWDRRAVPTFESYVIFLAFAWGLTVLILFPILERLVTR